MAIVEDKETGMSLDCPLCGGGPIYNDGNYEVGVCDDCGEEIAPEDFDD